ncbi:uncharacterized protein LOC133331963 [Musca vetustissima]|uniref:uncharacterized protein LOC133331963 n=1 Tax=Musca vetustissima TaxID=27455 RepID=UPI002AB6597F|nr:uncharacterized protein LOC133331963 [Musca vetustissima]
MDSASDANVDSSQNSQSDPETMPLLPCQKKYKLRPEDEISLDSIFSSLITKVQPSSEEFRSLEWNLSAKDFHNEKQSMLFEEKLYISQLQDGDCKLNEEVHIFMERELQEVGELRIRVEESYDGYVIYAKSNMVKDKGKFSSGHWTRGKYGEKFQLICEKRTEYDYVDNSRIERTLDARIIDNNLIAKRETKINREIQRFKAVINVKDRNDVFVLDGGVTLLMRHLILNNFRGDFQYFTMNLFGKILRCQLTINEQRKRIRLFHRTFNNIIHVVTTQYFNDYPQEVAETFFTANGKIVLHFWHGFRYVLHETKGYVEKRERIVPKLEIMWRSQNQLLDQYRLRTQLTYDNAMAYFEKHSELSDFLMDFVQNVIQYKPDNILEFAVRFFQKFRKPTEVA